MGSPYDDWNFRRDRERDFGSREGRHGMKRDWRDRGELEDMQIDEDYLVATPTSQRGPSPKRRKREETTAVDAGTYAATSTPVSPRESPLRAEFARSHETYSNSPRSGLLRETEKTQPQRDTPGMSMFNRLGQSSSVILRSSSSSLGGSGGSSSSFFGRIDSTTSHLHGGLGLGLGSSDSASPGLSATSTFGSPYSFDGRSLRGTNSGGEEFVPKTYNDSKRPIGSETFLHGMLSSSSNERDPYSSTHNGASHDGRLHEPSADAKDRTKMAHSERLSSSLPGTRDLETGNTGMGEKNLRRKETEGRSTLKDPWLAQRGGNDRSEGYKKASEKSTRTMKETELRDTPDPAPRDPRNKLGQVQSEGEEQEMDTLPEAISTLNTTSGDRLSNEIRSDARASDTSRRSTSPPEIRTKEVPSKRREMPPSNQDQQADSSAMKEESTPGKEHSRSTQEPRKQNERKAEDLTLQSRTDEPRQRTQISAQSQPRRRLGWGEGLVAFEKAKSGPMESSPLQSPAEPQALKASSSKKMVSSHEEHNRDKLNDLGSLESEVLPTETRKGDTFRLAQANADDSLSQPVEPQPASSTRMASAARDEAGTPDDCSYPRPDKDGHAEKPMTLCSSNDHECFDQEDKQRPHIWAFETPSPRPPSELLPSSLTGMTTSSPPYGSPSPTRQSRPPIWIPSSETRKESVFSNKREDQADEIGLSNEAFNSNQGGPELSSSSSTADAESMDTERDLPSKEDIVQSIEKVDIEIAKTEADLDQLKNLIFSKPEEDQREHRETVSPAHTASELRQEKAILTEEDLVQSIYQANRERLAGVLEQYATSLIPGMSQDSQSLHTRLCDIASYQESLQIHEMKRGSIKKILARQKKIRHRKQLALVSTYKQIQETYSRKMRKKEQEEARLAKKGSNGRLDPEPPLTFAAGRRTASRRHTDVVNSEAEFAEIMFELAAQESQAPGRYMRTLAQVPSMLDQSERNTVHFYDTNGLVDDAMASERERKLANPWTDEEKKIFIEKYLVYPKNFQKIASFLENKDTGACVTFYYSYKYMLNLKKLLREHQMKRRGIRKGSNVPRELQNLGISGSDYWIAETSAVRSSRLRSVDSVEGRRGRKPSIMAPAQRDSRQRPSIMAGGRASSASREKVAIIEHRDTQYEDGQEEDEDYVDTGPSHTFRIQEGVDNEDIDILNNTPKSNREEETLRSEMDDEEVNVEADESVSPSTAVRGRPSAGVKQARTTTIAAVTPRRGRPNRRPSKQLRERPRPARESLANRRDAQPGSYSAQETSPSALDQNGSPPSSPPPPTPSPSSSPELEKDHLELPFGVDEAELAYSRGKGAERGRSGKAKNKTKTESGKNFPLSPPTFSSSSAEGAVAQPSSPCLSPSSSSSSERKPAKRQRRLLPGEEEVLNRWTDSETLLFAEAFHNISKDFKSIAEYIGTKNQFQCKEYYHYYRSRLGLDDAADKTARRVIEEEEMNAGGEKEKEKNRDIGNWTTGEKQDFLKFFSIYGRNWKMLASHIPSKTQTQIKNYFHNYKIKLQQSNASSLEKDPAGLADSENNISDLLPSAVNPKGKVGRRRKVSAPMGMLTTSPSPSGAVRSVDESGEGAVVAGLLAPNRGHSPHKGSIAALLNSPPPSPSRFEEPNNGVMDTESTSSWFPQNAAIHHLHHHLSSPHSLAPSSSSMYSRDPYGGIGGSEPPRSLSPPTSSFFASPTTSLAPLRGFHSLYGTSSSYDEEYRDGSSRYMDEREKSSSQLYSSRYSSSLLSSSSSSSSSLSTSYRVQGVGGSSDTDGVSYYNSRQFGSYYYRGQTNSVPSEGGASGGQSACRRDDSTISASTSTTTTTATIVPSSAHHAYRNTAGGDTASVPGPSASPYSYAYSRSSLYGSTSSSPYTLSNNLFAGNAIPAHLLMATAPAPTSSLVSSTSTLSVYSHNEKSGTHKGINKDESASDSSHQASFHEVHPTIEQACSTGDHSEIAILRDEGHASNPPLPETSLPSSQPSSCLEQPVLLPPSQHGGMSNSHEEEEQEESTFTTVHPHTEPPLEASTESQAKPCSPPLEQPSSQPPTPHQPSPPPPSPPLPSPQPQLPVLQQPQSSSQVLAEECQHVATPRDTTFLFPEPPHHTSQSTPTSTFHDTEPAHILRCDSQAEVNVTVTMKTPFVMDVDTQHSKPGTTSAMTACSQPHSQDMLTAQFHKPNPAAEQVLTNRLQVKPP